MCVSIRQLKEEFLAKCKRFETSEAFELWEKLHRLGWENRDKSQTLNNVDIDATAFVSDQEAEEIRRKCTSITGQSVQATH
jgi:hypothetical protein